MNDTNRDQQVFNVYQQVLTMDVSQRDLYLNDACADDQDMRERVEQLLASAKTEDPMFDGFLERELLASGIKEMSEHTELPNAIGPYQIKSVLGEGGMGKVFLAQQNQPKRMVAIKLIKPGMDSERVLKRFQQESQLLAHLEHPHIAAVFEVGLSEQGYPYFAMEYIDGMPITYFCDSRAMSVKQRLALFIRVCDAVQYAHQRGVIHRDLKPSNILITEIEGEAIPKIIDFGIAKATEESIFDQTNPQPHTATGMVIGSQGYMSPEQAGFNNDAVDTRTDVYALGVLLYELLVGASPFGDMEGEGNNPWVWKPRKIIKPGVQYRNLNDSDEAARQRGCNSRELTKMLEGDLNWITLKALEEEKDRRYGSPRDLAQDIEHFIASRPVSACPPSLTYLINKFVRRNKAVVSFSVLTLLLLVGGLISTQVALRQSRAETERTKMTVNLLQELISFPDPDQKGPEARVQDLLDDFASQVDSRTHNQPEIQATLLQTIGVTYNKLSLYQKGLPHVEKALEIRKDLLGKNHVETLIISDQLAENYSGLGQFEEAESLLRETRILWQETNEATSEYALRNETILGLTLSNLGKLDEAEDVLSANLKTRSQYLKSSHPDTLDTMEYLAIIYMQKRRHDKAFSLQHKALDRRINDLPDRRAIINSLYHLGNTYMDSEDPDFALPLLHQAWLDGLSIYGPDSRDVLMYRNSYAFVLMRTGQFLEADFHFREIIETCKKLLGEDHPTTLSYMHNYAINLYYLNDLGQAEMLHRSLAVSMATAYGEFHPYTYKNLADLVFILNKQGCYIEAEQKCRLVLAYREKNFGMDHDITKGTRNFLAKLLRKQGRDADADALLSSGAK